MRILPFLRDSRGNSETFLSKERQKHKGHKGTPPVAVSGSTSADERSCRYKESKVIQRSAKISKH